ncbi:MAG: tetratricopeptide repeat protein [Gammaproteobacteria bacterium]|nr:tetratricopeptide repeat protein [Gammaproteobacteria bacterium]
MKKNLTGVLIILSLLGFSLTVQAASLENIGTFDFPTSGSPEAQKHFLLGVGYLHSFGWKQARVEFQKAQEIEPDFAMAYWGEVFSYNHPLRRPETAPDAPMRVLEKLGATSAERLGKAPTEREKGFLRAAEAYAFDEGGVSGKRTAWMNAMKKHYEAFPDDREVAAFYAVSMISGATAAGDQRNRTNYLAGSIALELFRENENHPGAAHYIIHAFDDPEHAPISLAAALKYATIAPAVAHARHMPTHIFIQHGMWREVADYNINAFQAGEDLWQPGDSPGDQNHSSDWGEYGHLQLGDYAYAREWIAKAEKVLALNPDSRRSMSTVRNMKARYVVETQQWQKREVTSATNAGELLAIGMSAINLGDTVLTEQVVAKLGEMAQANPDNSNLNIIYREVSGLALSRQGKAQQAETLFDEAIALTDAQRPPNGAANPFKPAHELYGEVMLAQGNAKKARELFSESLLRMPNRPRSVLGLARSYAQLGMTEDARAQYQKLTHIWVNKDLSGYEEAISYLSDSGK